MTTSLQNARTFQDQIDSANKRIQAAVPERDAEIIEARKRDVSVIEISETLGLSRQQVHKIVRRPDLPGKEFSDMSDDELDDIGMYRCQCGEAVHPDGGGEPHCELAAAHYRALEG